MKRKQAKTLSRFDVFGERIDVRQMYTKTLRAQELLAERRSQLTRRLDEERSS